MNTSLLILFARYPRPGSVKTRLSDSSTSPHPISAQAACDLYSAFLEDLIPRFYRESDFDFRIMLGGASTKEQEAFQNFHRLESSQIYSMPRHTTGLGELMENCFAQATHEGHQQTVLIGSDTPHLSRLRIQEAFSALGQNPIVIGPDNGGGMYLVGYTQPWGMMKEGIQWSQGTDCQEVLRRCRQHQLNVHLLPEEIDIDTSEDWQSWYEASLNQPSSTIHDCTSTRPLIQQWVKHFQNGSVTLCGDKKGDSLA